MSVATHSADLFDLVLVGGGLQNGLIALHVLHRQPACRIAMVEAAPQIGGNHTWCVHALDVSEAARAWFDPLVVQRWDGYDVLFPKYERRLRSGYAVVSSAHFARVVGDAFASHPQCRLLTGARALRLSEHTVDLEDGRILRGRLVVDARGPEPLAFAGQCGYQKFVGLELRTRKPHGLQRPILMDVRVPQTDGFRFFYVLPLASDRLLVEETRFSLNPALARDAAHHAIHAYAARFCEVAEVVREEVGVLPMPWALQRSAAAAQVPSTGALLAGYRGGFFHPATGYSLPAAARVAEALGQSLCEASADGPLLGASWERFVRGHRLQSGYALQLNRLLFTGFAETDMWGVLSRFYTLSEGLIERFYAQSSSRADRARILIGWPPRGFSLRRALAARSLPAQVGAA